MSNCVEVTSSGGTLLISINRPEVRNAIDRQTALAIESAIDQLEGTTSFLVGILTGAGATFCSGMDLRSSAKGDLPYGDRRGFGGLVEPPGKPLIAAVEGFALGGGFEMALACDLVVAAVDAIFGLPEVTRGTVAGGGGLLRLPDRIPRNQAMELALVGNRLTAQRAAELGLINRLVPTGSALSVAIDLAQAISRNGPLAVAASKSVIVESPGWPRESLFEAQREIVDEIRQSSDAHEGAKALLRAGTRSGEGVEDSCRVQSVLWHHIGSAIRRISTDSTPNGLDHVLRSGDRARSSELCARIQHLNGC